jgi:hypothetical protein
MHLLKAIRRVTGLISDPVDNSAEQKQKLTWNLQQKPIRVKSTACVSASVPIDGWLTVAWVQHINVITAQWPDFVASARGVRRVVATAGGGLLVIPIGAETLWQAGER